MGKRSHSHKSRERDTLEDEHEGKKSKLDDNKKLAKRKHKHKVKHKKQNKEKKQKIKGNTSKETGSAEDDDSLNDRLLNDRAKAMAPMTKEEWDRRQSIVRRVVDEETGRTRLVKGDGEILEEIVSKQEHSRINKLATKNDGQFFQQSLISKTK
ncbi:ADP-ribosylation factor-like protein 6-interacting protein 4 [Bacillus rossius redtenbacheri]|uniref:ADP-ribosylation factor-like protein 6-interacting protein 4 n=1 Tax=Bacillus rossius redtenbacheri TaxID=93214 RepID=UPI002FDCED38